MRDPELMAAVEAGPLGDLPVPVVDRILADATLVRASAGTTLYHPGDPVGLHLVVAGLIRVAMTSPEGRQVTIRYARHGEVLGAPIVVAGSVPVTAHAVTDAAVARTPPDLLAALARNDSRVALWLADELSRRVRGLLDELARNTFFPVRARIARHLLDLATGTQRGTQLEARISQQELADAVGTVREVVTRTLAGLRTEGLVETERDRIRITDPQGLATVADTAR
ncbi:Crp/Fnr family transcriptional regulator [Geodermatophilus sp. SYSU D00758]